MIQYYYFFSVHLQLSSVGLDVFAIEMRVEPKPLD